MLSVSVKLITALFLSGLIVMKFLTSSISPLTDNRGKELFEKSEVVISPLIVTVLFSERINVLEITPILEEIAKL